MKQTKLCKKLKKKLQTKRRFFTSKLMKLSSAAGLEKVELNFNITKVKTQIKLRFSRFKLRPLRFSLYNKFKLDVN